MSELGDGEGWVQCEKGHRHWGRFGAAGLFLTEAERAVLQHRAAWTHEGNTWSIPGGARAHGETAVAAALRESFEEGALVPESVAPYGLLVDDHGGWSYVTVVARPRTRLEPRVSSPESRELRWCDFEEIDRLPRHPGFNPTWWWLRMGTRPLHLVVDAMRWPEAERGGLPEKLLELARNGIPAAELPPGITGGPLTVLLPQVLFLGTRGDMPSASSWWNRAVEALPRELGRERLSALEADATVQVLHVEPGALAGRL